ncbi:Vacuolar protein sorting-associated protein 62 [Pleurostoma richardsiae]|uniref:Vacuolar protein sorting-associated protein 62 n=1 Tax=Pleurostoma richardsiae TaxID=41990 RepID=A0AA38R8Y1_9PEZI|nr:Vacuolar protein sorting-associated protein 62 [Pleurostoma richardsiae]
MSRYIWDLIVVGLLACSAWAEPDVRCPQYVASYAPLIWLHSDDPYKPSDLLAHIRHTTPVLDGQSVTGLPSLNLDNLETLNKFGHQVALTANEDPTTYPAWLFGETPDASGQLPNATACVVVLVQKNQRDVDVFYFYFYSYNEGANITQVLEPLDHLVAGGKADTGMHFGNHVGDWEHNMVRFQDGKPVGIFYSQHVDGAAYDWNDPLLSKTDNGRPIVYSARGSHANYATPGDQVHNAALVDYCDEGQRWDPVLSAYFYRFDPAASKLTRLADPDQSSPSPPSSNFTSFFYFTAT